MQTNNKLREVLAEIRLLLVRVPRFIKSDIACGIINAKVKRALTEPPRNCDVGTVTEQIGRFENFCDSYKQNCEGCPLANYDSKTLMGCAIKWVQLPYEEGGAK